MLNRRQAIGLLAGAAPALKLARAAVELPIAPGPFKGTRESLREWQVPAWYRDAKFGIWAHWGPQSAPEYGDWYARNMYIQGHRQYEYHVKTYGHPTKFGFKDVIPTWKADKFDPDHLLQLYKKAGAKYFCSMAVHHDGFDLWKSDAPAALERRRGGAEEGHRRAVQEGDGEAGAPFRRKRAPRAGLSLVLHFAHAATRPARWPACPTTAPTPPTPTSINELQKDYPYGKQVSDRQAPDPWKQLYFRRIKDLVDNYQPDLLYTDGDIFFEEYGLALVANLYNLSAKRHGGRVEAVYTSKLASDCEIGTCVLDLERGVAGRHSSQPLAD